MIQENCSIKDYYKDMEMAILRAYVEENREATMVQLLSGLRPKTLQHYIEIDEM